MSPTDSEPTFLQIYFMDDSAADQVERPSRITDGSFKSSGNYRLTIYHLYVRELNAAYEFANRNSPDHRIAICESRRPAETHEGIYNVPTVNEFAVLLPNNPVGQCDKILHTRSNQLRLHRGYEPQISSHSLFHMVQMDGVSNVN